MDRAAPPSIVHGPPLAEEAGIGALTIAGYAREVCGRWGDREALVMPHMGGRIAWSYHDLWAHSMAVARATVAAGIGKDGRVGILMTNRPEYISALFGIALAGGVAVPLSTFSTPIELDHLLRLSGVTVLLYDRQVLRKDFGAMLVELEPAVATTAAGTLRSPRYPFLRRLVALDDVSGGDGDGSDPAAVERWDDFIAAGRDIADAVVEARDAATTPADIGALFFSSGTTSLPKGILHAQRALALQWWRWRVTMQIDAERWPVRCWTGNGFFWSGNISQVIGYALTTGGAIVLQPLFQADEALALMQQERVSFAIGRPHQWARLEASPGWATADLSSLHYITNPEMMKAHPSVTTEWDMCPAYGTTETLTINTAVCANTPFEVYRGSYGQPLAGNVLKIFDPATGAVVPRGSRGEIAIKGPTLMLGYLGKTADETFDPDGFFRTGDGGYVDAEGWLFWEGRLTDMIKTGGANVSPIEVDAALVTCPGVRRSETVGLPHATLGEVVVACIVPHDGATLSEAEVQAWLRARLASFKIPRAVLFFRDEELAVTGSGKVKTGQLRELAAGRLTPEQTAAA